MLKEFELNARIVLDAGGDPAVVDASPRNPGPDEGEVTSPGEALGEELRRQSIEAERKQLEREQKVNLREEWSQQQAERDAKQED